MKEQKQEHVIKQRTLCSLQNPIAREKRDRNSAHGTRLYIVFLSKAKALPTRPLEGSEMVIKNLNIPKF